MRHGAVSCTRRTREKRRRELADRASGIPRGHRLRGERNRGDSRAPQTGYALAECSAKG